MPIQGMWRPAYKTEKADAGKTEEAGLMQEYRIGKEEVP